jgi:hypothetical protein
MGSDGAGGPVTSFGYAYRSWDRVWVHLQNSQQAYERVWKKAGGGKAGSHIPSYII